MPETEIIRTAQQARSFSAHLREGGVFVSLIPTMGALHDGHISLIDTARKNAGERAKGGEGAVIVSIFINPIQFGVGEDFDKYPRMEEEDIAKLRDIGVDAVYIPTVEEMYPHGADTVMQFRGETASVLCGASRAGHFDGVGTIVLKLLMQMQPDAAIFGEKDYQQLFLIKRMVRDFFLPTDIISSPTIREESGLAKSSRNKYLSPKQKSIAAKIYAVMKGVAQQRGEDLTQLMDQARTKLLEYGFDKVEYIEIRRESDLSLITQGGGLTDTARVFTAAHLGGTRLIDNLRVSIYSR